MPTVLTLKAVLLVAAELHLKEMVSLAEVTFIGFSNMILWVMIVCGDIKISFNDFADIDECSTVIPCHTKAECTNTEGSYQCQCLRGKAILKIQVIIWSQAPADENQ